MEKESRKKISKKTKLDKNLSKEKNMGITLIALIITIIVLLILAAVSIATLTGENGILTRANDARFQTNLATLKEEIEIYKVGEQLNNKIGIDQYPVIKEETLEKVDKNIINEKLKQKMVKWATTAGKDEIATIDTIDYSKFYKLDKEKIKSANNFKGDLYLIALENEYKVISIEGEEYQNNTIYVLIPLNDIADPEYIAVANNTYKLYGNGTIKVVGELTQNSGMTEEDEEKLMGIHELDIEKIAKGTEMKIDKNVETEDEIAKGYGVKRIYISCDTAYVIDAENNLWAWGDNQYNKLGQGNSYLVSTPIKIFENAKNVWAGTLNTYVLDNNNQLWGAGANTHGQLGQGNTNIYNNFVKININGLDLNTTNIKKIDVNMASQEGNAIIICDNGKAYGCGSNKYGQLGIGNTQSQTSFIDLTSYDEKWSNVKDLFLAGTYTFVLTTDNNLYASGVSSQGNLGIDNNGQIVLSLLKVKDNIEEISQGNGMTCKSIDGTVWNIANSKFYEISKTKGKNVKLINNSMIVMDKKLYKINSTRTEIEIYSNEYIVEPKILEGKKATQFVSNNKIYIENLPNVTNPNSKSIYKLKQVFNNAIFMQGKGTNLSIVDTNGNIYESLNNQNTEVTNVKKLVTSAGARYALTNTGELYSKGHQYTGMWGLVTSKNKYVQVTKDGAIPFDNIKDIYTTNAINKTYAASAVFITEDNKIYWAGSTTVTPLPNIQGDIQTTGMGKITEYPKEVTTGKILELKDKIVDIKMNYINSAGIQGRNGLILTEDGKVYTYAQGRSSKNMTGLDKVTSDYEEIKVKEGETAKEIETQDGLSLVLLSNGEVYGWGYNTYGILGEGYELGEIYPTPVKLKLENIRTMTLGDNFAIFETYAGEVYGIGKNDYGQLGTGDNTGASTFVRCEELEK